ncbi:MAG: Ig-like domain-containing protein, partial [Pseudomonadota bacterium]
EKRAAAVVARVHADRHAVRAGQQVFTQPENNPPYAVFGDTSGDFAGETLVAGAHSVTVRMYSGNDGGGTFLGETTVAFTVAPAPVEDGAVEGYFFTDQDEDGVRDPVDQDPPTVGHRVELRQGDSLIATTTTDANGAYRFENVPPDAGYTVRFYHEDAATAFARADGQTVGTGGNLNSAAFTVVSGETVSGVNAALEAPNQPPNVTGETTSIQAGTTETVDVLANETDPDGDALTLINVVAPEGLTATIVDDELSVSVGRNTTGTEQVTYTVSDGNGGDVEGTLTVNVDPANGIDDNEARVYQLENGWVKIEAESGTWQLPSSGTRNNWLETTEFVFDGTGQDGKAPQPIEDPEGNGPTGDGALVYVGPDRFDDADRGLARTAPILYRFEVGEEDLPEDGSPVTFQLKARVIKPEDAGVNGADAANDIWFKWGQEGTFEVGSIDQGGWFKAHVKPFDNQGNRNEHEPLEWSWLGHRAQNGGDVPVQMQISEPGIYEFAIGARSQFVAIDQIQIVSATPIVSPVADRAESPSEVYTPTPPNQAPVAVDDAASTPEDMPVTVAVLSNDTDPDGAALTVSIDGAPT